MRIQSIALSAFLTMTLAVCVAAQSLWPTKRWPTSTASAVGLDPASLAALDKDFSAGKYGLADSMLVIRHGEVAYDRSYRHDYDRIYGAKAKVVGPLNPDPKGPYNYFNPDWHPYYRRGDLHTLQSVTKTVTSVILGAAVARKEFPSDLDTPILRWFDGTRIANLDDRKRRITLRHVLTMTAGLSWNEDLPNDDPRNSVARMEASADWVRFVIDLPMAREPGAVFVYSSGATQLLSHIFKKETGRDIDEYARQHLFGPLGIRKYYWKRTHTGLADTEGGLYLRPHDLAKIGYLFLRNGVWDGKQVVTEEWVQTSVALSVTAARPGRDYGLKWWLYPRRGRPGHLAWAAHGFGGQRLIVVPEQDMVLVFTGWSIPTSPFNTREVLDRILRAVKNRPGS